MPKKKEKIKLLSGFRDILPEEQEYFDRIYKVVSDLANFYNFQKIDTPILERADLFSRGVGQSTDIVRKEMYVFKTKGKDFVALRPEGTAPVVRSYFEQGMQSWIQPVRLWYFGPFFRHERPQYGRYRQFHQFGFEVLNSESSIIDAEIIKISFDILKELGFKNLKIKINSIGCNNCRPYYKKILKNYFKSRKKSLCRDCKRRLKENVLRILDCKQEKCQRIANLAPQSIDYLCPECKNHFKQLLEYLDYLEIPYQLDTHLVRGLDYYTKTVFEVFEDSDIGKCIGALIGGGRYDNLAELIGFEKIPACGAAGGIERMIELMKKKKVLKTKIKKKRFFLIQIGNLAKKKSIKLLEEFRKNKIEVLASLDRDSLKSQLRVADKMGVKYVLILGQKEVLDKSILIRDMETKKQRSIKLKNVLKEIKKL